MGRKLIFLDVDGTLTTPGGYEPPESAQRAIKRARDLGHMVFLCSGRNYCMLEPLLEYGFDGCIASCGGQVYTGDELLYDCPFTEEQKNRVLELFDLNGVHVTIEGSDASFYDEEPLRILRDNRDRKAHILDMIKAVWVDLGARPMSEYDGSPKLKEKSDIVCPAVDDDGIEWAFRKLGLVDE